eukprot:GHVU01020857.1.p1 GENE.GHVU01020857.1~~GHVU01020857.1.p1  ORF type:complete len:597 (-),score=101.45 GHVU01020857.1:1602-3392(-)
MVGAGGSRFCYDEVLGKDAHGINRDEAFDGLTAARMIEEKVNVNVEALVEQPVTAFLSDESGELSRAKRILALRWPAVYWGKCFAHQLNRLVGDVLKHTCFLAVATLAIALVSCVNNSKVWRNVLTNKCRQVYERFGVMLQATENRWCSAQACFASILRLKKALQLLMLEQSYQLPSGLANVHAQGDKFWTDLQHAHDVVLALAKSQLVLQRDQGSLADVVYAYGAFRAAMGHLPDVVAQVEKRWKTTEQPLLLLVCCLDKRYVADFRQRCRGNGVVTAVRLSQLAVYYHKRFIGDDTTGLADAFLDWWEGKVLEESVYTGDRFWKVMLENCNPAMKKLASLAQRVVSLPVHSADCERLFSDYGNIKTPERNRMGNRKMQMLTQVKHDMREKRREQQRVASKKRKRLVSCEPYRQRLPPSSTSANQQQPSSSSSNQQHSSSSSSNQQQSSSSSSNQQHSSSSSSTYGPQQASESVDFDEVEVMYEVAAADLTNDTAVADQWALRFRAMEEEQDTADEEAPPPPSYACFTEAAIGYVHETGLEYRRTNPLPLVNNPRYPQDELQGVRAWKVPLEVLFPPGCGVAAADELMEAVQPFF